jgi:hypothetical protein
MPSFFVSPIYGQGECKASLQEVPYKPARMVSRVRHIFTETTTLIGEWPPQGESNCEAEDYWLLASLRKAEKR